MLRLAVHLLVILMTVFLNTRRAATTECYCSDCVSGTNTCISDWCTSEAALDPNNGQIVKRWRCLDATINFRICNQTTAIFSMLCCNSSNFCNTNMIARLDGEEDKGSGGNISSTDGPDPVTVPSQNPGTVPDPPTDGIDLPSNGSNSTEGTVPTLNSTAQPTAETVPYPNTTPQPTNGTDPVLTTPRPIISPSSIECFVSSSSSPTLTTTTLCAGTTSCFVSLRIKADGTRLYRRGCSRENSPCIEEDRPRKKKRCCASLFCNHPVPPSWEDDEEVTEATEETTPTEPPSHPGAASLSPFATPPGSTEGENCTVSDADSIKLTPCVGPGSAPSHSTSPPAVTTPADSSPNIVPVNGESDTSTIISCFCNDCGTSYACSSRFGCLSQYRYDPIVDQIRIRRSCINDALVLNRTCGITLPHLQTACCMSNLCNRPPLNVQRPTIQNDNGPTDTTDPITGARTEITMATDTVTVANVSVETIMTDGNRVTVDGNSESDGRGEEDPIIFYILSGLLGLLIFALAIVLLILLICCCCYRTTNQPKTAHPSRTQSGRGHGGVAMATTRIAIDDKMHVLQENSSGLQGSSFTTLSTRTSTPESTV